MNVDSPALNSISLCSGVGMLDLGVSIGLEYLGIRTRPVAYLERESSAAAMLLARMEEQTLEPAPVWCGNLETFDYDRFCGVVDILTAGFPCQPHSVAGKREGTDDDRWIWPAIMDAIRRLGCPLVYLENVPGLLSSGGFDAVLRDLHEGGFDAEWTTLRASEVGASHQRERLFILAVCKSRGFGELRQSSGGSGFVDGSNKELDHADRNGVERAGRTECGTQTGCFALANTESGRGGFGLGAEQPWRSEVEGAGIAMDHAPSPRHHGTRSGADTDSEGGECVPGAGCAAVAHTGFAHAGSEVGRFEVERTDASGPASGASGSGESLGNTESLGNGSRSLPLRNCASIPFIVGGSGALADAGHQCARTDQSQRLHRGRGEADDCAGGNGMAHPSSPRQQGSEQRGTRNSDRGGAETHGSTSELCGLFAPGPSDPRWPAILEQFPQLAPALTEEKAERHFRGMVDGDAAGLDDPRYDRLRAVGNGVVATCAAAAFVVLARRLGIGRQEMKAAA